MRTLSIGTVNNTNIVPRDSEIVVVEESRSIFENVASPEEKLLQLIQRDLMKLGKLGKYTRSEIHKYFDVEDKQ